jgi:lipopolysaccharide export system protein LptA
MPTRLTPALRALAAVLVLGAAAPALHAEKADRAKPMVVEADRPGTVDLQRQVVVFNGNVTISQGTMVIRAERVELREMADGYRAATAIGSAAKPASYRQKRDGVDETVEGAAERIEFDGRAETLRFVGNGAVRRLRGSTVADEIAGNLITWDARAEVFSVEGGAATPANPGGRVRAVLTPREAASAPPAPPTPLQPSRALGGERR